jgi:sugar (pentulose or hexulose) kinase
MSIAVIAIFDIGKTNKKVFLFDSDYHLVYEKSEILKETVDEDGDPCEDVEILSRWIMTSFDQLIDKTEFDIKAINFATYGASFVLIDENGNAIPPLYSYLKKYPEDLMEKFYRQYGGENAFSFLTASPPLGNLNSGMQLYRIKSLDPSRFTRIKFALHLPQYASYLLTGKLYSDVTSIGCHTNLWDFQSNKYHAWVKAEGVEGKLPPLVSSVTVTDVTIKGKGFKIGVGLHDSSAALIPYLVSFDEPFALISTGTWCITLNPFNNSPLTETELSQDCLCYLQYNGKQVKASRLFAGYFHEQQVARIADHFKMDTSFYKTIEYSPSLIKDTGRSNSAGRGLKESIFERRDLNDFSSAAEAYHQFMYDLVLQQFISSQLVIAGTKVNRIFVDGGFCNNTLYMNLLASFFPEIKVYAASMAQATALGAALAIHDSWNTKRIAKNLIELKLYARTKEHQL